MGDSLTLVSVVGARPQFVKLAPIVRAIEGKDGIAHRIVHTGQHYDDNMSAAFFEQLELPRPDLDLNIGSGSHAEQTGAMLVQLEQYLCKSPPHAVLTYGDTNSTLAATLAASKMNIRVAHVEAGLRSFNRAMPEELNRLVADHCSDRLYAPTPQAMRNLEREDLQERAVFSGDVMRDAILHNVEIATKRSTALKDLALEVGQFGLVTVHRPVNTSRDVLQRVLDALEKTAASRVQLIFAVHPRTRVVLNAMGYQAPKRLRLVEPLPYLDTIALIQAAALIITDSGGVQKEAAFLQTPCLTMRNETEWTETLDIGINKLVGNAAEGLVAAVAEIQGMADPFDSEALASIRSHYGEGDAAERIIADCVHWLS